MAWPGLISCQESVGTKTSEVDTDKRIWLGSTEYLKPCFLRTGRVPSCISILFPFTVYKEESFSVTETNYKNRNPDQEISNITTKSNFLKNHYPGTDPQFANIVHLKFNNNLNDFRSWNVL